MDVSEWVKERTREIDGEIDQVNQKIIEQYQHLFEGERCTNHGMMIAADEEMERLRKQKVEFIAKKKSLTEIIEYERLVHGIIS